MNETDLIEKITSLELRVHEQRLAIRQLESDVSRERGTTRYYQQKLDALEGQTDNQLRSERDSIRMQYDQLLRRVYAARLVLRSGASEHQLKKYESGLLD